jgi:type IV secretion system protein VirB9
MSFVFYLLAIFCVTFNVKANDGGIYSSTKKQEPSFKRIVVEPRQMGHDPRFKTFAFTPNTTYKIVAVYDNPSFIEFETNESVATIVNPKKSSWQLIPSGNRLFLKPEESDADTQITVMTNKRIYFFEMYAKEPSSNFDKDYSFFFKFKYPSEEESKTIRTYAKSILPDVDQNPWKYNFNYTITGEDSLYPVKIFDDGEFTYFEFPRTSKMPAIFAVDSNGFESIVNFRIVGEYLIVEEVSGKFTLRNGADIVCVFNENMYKPKNSKRPKKRDYSYEIEQYNNEERNKQDSMIYN